MKCSLTISVRTPRSWPTAPAKKFNLKTKHHKGWKSLEGTRTLLTLTKLGRRLAVGHRQSTRNLYKVSAVFSLKGSFINFPVLPIAIKLYGKSWKHVEDYIGTRTSAQIRSHAQKYFSRIDKELQEPQASSFENSRLDIDTEVHKALSQPGQHQKDSLVATFARSLQAPDLQQSNFQSLKNTTSIMYEESPVKVA